MSVGTCLLRGIHDFYQENRYTDITVDVQGHSFYCHKVVLSAVSGFFNGMFSSGMKEASSSKVCLKDINVRAFKDLVEFVYTEKDVVAESNVEELFKVSSMLQVPCLHKRCEEFMTDSIETDNCIGVWKLAKVFSNEHLEKECWLFILKHFETIRHKGEFCKLDACEVTEIISSDDLNIEREDNVCKAVFRWIQTDYDNRKQFVQELFQHVRLTSISLDVILDEIDTQQMIRSNEVCSNLVRRAIQFHALPAKRQEFSKFQDSLRSNSNYENLLIVIGRRTTLYGEGSLEFIGYSSERKKWYCLNSSSCDVGEEFATCVHGDYLMISGGTKKSTACLSYSPHHCRWKKRSDFNNGRYRHAMVGVNNFVYVLGGYNSGTLNSVEEYDIFNDTWKTAGKLCNPVDATAAAVIGSNIYVFGGWSGFSEETAAIQCFDSKTYTCTIVSQLHSPSQFTRALACGNRIEIVCSDGKILSFSPECGAKIVNTIHNFSRKNFGVIKDQSGLYILGGEELKYVDKFSSDDVREAYRIEGANIAIADQFNLPVKMEIQGCFMHTIPKSDFLSDFAQMIEFDT